MSERLPSFMHEDLRCCVCHATDPSEFTLLYKKEDFAVVSCDNCTFTFIPPFYRKRISYTQYKGAAVADAVRAGNNWVKIQRHLLRFKFIKRFVKKGKLFDLGAGWGHFMLAGKQLGYDVSGIEIAEQPYRYCVEDLKLPVRHVDFFMMDENEKYDVVTLWDVLEHIDRADDFVAKISRITAPGGYLILQVPQIDSFFARIYKDDWKMMGLDHVNYFSKKTIKRLLSQYGFEVVAIKSSFEIKLFLMYTLLPLIKRLRSRKKQTQREASASINVAERQAYFNKFTSRPKWQLKLFVGAHNMVYNTLSKLHVGEEMMVAAKKIK